VPWPGALCVMLLRLCNHDAEQVLIGVGTREQQHVQLCVCMGRDLGSTQRCLLPFGACCLRVTVIALYTADIRLENVTAPHPKPCL